jgi:abortive infection bacteriophage resistance protein
MHYSDPPLAYDDLAALAISRGLGGINQEDLARMLRVVGYYRLSTYWFPFKQDEKAFKPGATWVEVMRRYLLDCDLRLLSMSGLECIEIWLRNSLVQHHSTRYQAFGYLDRSTLPCISLAKHEAFVQEALNNALQSREEFVIAHRHRFTADEHLPIWMASELMSMGMLLTLYKGMDVRLRSSVASRFGISEEVFTSWLTTLYTLRNICAHHRRLWNRCFGPTLKIPRPGKHIDWHTPVEIEGEITFGVLSVIAYLLALIDIDRAREWRRRLDAVLVKHGEDLMTEAGFPATWRMSPIWSPP